MEKRGEITLFLAMILMSVFTLLCAVTESARTAGFRWYLRTAGDSAMDSLMAQYHRPLWQNYRILGLEEERAGQLQQELERFITPYLEAENWYTARFLGTQIRERILLTDQGGQVFEEEILNYMKYGLLRELWDEVGEGQAEELLTTLKEGTGVNRTSDLYELHARDAVRLEKALEALNDRLETQKQHWSRGLERLGEYDGSGFIFQAEQVIKSLNKVPGLTKQYEDRADRLQKKLTESRKQFEQEEGLGEESGAWLDQEIAAYESYTSEDGERRREIHSMTGRSEEAVRFAEEMIRQAEEVIRYIDDWEPDDEDDELDLDELWSPVRESWERFPLLSLNVAFGVRDKEKEGFLERLRDMAEGNLLKLVLPEGTKVSGKSTWTPEAPSFSPSEQLGQMGVRHLADRIIVGEYAVRYFPFFQKDRTEGLYEMEYILWGKGKDRDNLEASVRSLVGLRQGMNLLTILSSPSMVHEARTLGAAIAGGVGLLPFTEVMTFFVIAVWALGEALADVSCLCDGGKVPLKKTPQQWKLSLEALLGAGKEKRLPQLSGGDEGMDYRGYLRLMFFLNYDRDQVYRMMDMVQKNLAEDQKSFRLRQCAAYVDMEMTVCGKPLFFSGGRLKTHGEMTFQIRGTYLETPI